MSDSMTSPAQLEDSQLQSLAAEWRLRAMRGDQLAQRMAAALEAEQRRRIRDSGLAPLPPSRSAVHVPWWKFW